MIFVWLWHNLLSSMTSSSIHFPINVITLFSDLSKNYVAYAHHFLFICSSAHGHPGWLRSLATVKSAAVHDVKVSLCCADFESFGHAPRCGITGSHYRYIFRVFFAVVLFFILFFYFINNPVHNGSKDSLEIKLTKVAKDQTLKEEAETDMRNRKRFHAHGLAELTVWKWTSQQK